MEDLLDGVPNQLFGYHLKTKTQIICHYMLPAIFELCIYIILTTADVALIVQHFRDNHITWGIFTLIFVLLPAVLCFITIITSPAQWPKYQQQQQEQELYEQETLMRRKKNRQSSMENNNMRTTNMKCINCKFFLKHLLNLIIFPISSIYRLVV